MKSKDLIRELEAAGWKLDRIKGDHHIFKKPGFKRSVVVPHPKKDLPIGTLKAIKKQAGLN